VTSLIGITIDNIAKFGIIHYPFYDRDHNYGMTYFGGLEIGIFNAKYDKNATRHSMLSRGFVYNDPHEELKDGAEDDYEVKVITSITIKCIRILQFIFKLIQISQIHLKFKINFLNLNIL
jgi:hypothetical protein